MLDALEVKSGIASGTAVNGGVSANFVGANGTLVVAIVDVILYTSAQIRRR